MSEYRLFFFASSWKEFQKAIQEGTLRKWAHCPCRLIELENGGIALLSSHVEEGEKVSEFSHSTLVFSRKKVRVRKVSSEKPLLFHCPLIPWEKEPAQPEVVLLSPCRKVLEEELQALLQFGTRELEAAEVTRPEGGALFLLRFTLPSFFFIRRWQSRKDLELYYAVSPRVYLLWGFQHPWHESLQSKKEWLFVGWNKIYRLSSLSFHLNPFQFSLPEVEWEELQALSEAPVFRLPLTLVSSSDKKPPSLWRLTQEDLQLLVEKVDELSGELRSKLFLSKCASSEGKPIYFLVKKTPHPLPKEIQFQGEAFYSLPSHVEVYLPLGWELKPAFVGQELPGQFSKEDIENHLLLFLPSSSLKIWLLPKSSFRPFSEVFHFWMDVEKEKLEKLALEIPLHLRYTLVEKKETASLQVSSSRPKALEKDLPSLPYLSRYHSSEYWQEVAKTYGQRKQDLSLAAWAEAIWWEKDEKKRKELVQVAAKHCSTFPRLLTFSSEQILSKHKELYQELVEQEGKWPLKLRWLVWRTWSEALSDPVEQMRQAEKILRRLSSPPKELSSLLSFVWERELKRQNQEWGKPFLEKLWQDWSQTGWAFRQCRQRVLSAVAAAYFDLQLCNQAMTLVRHILSEMEEEKDCLVLSELAYLLHQYGQPGAEKLARKSLSQMEGLLSSSRFPHLLGGIFRIWHLLPGRAPLAWKKQILSMVEKLAEPSLLNLFVEYFDFLLEEFPPKDLKARLKKVLSKSLSHPKGWRLLRHWRTLFCDPLPFSFSLPLQGSFEELYPFRYHLAEAFQILSRHKKFSVPSLNTPNYSTILTAKILILICLDQEREKEALSYLEKMWHLTSHVSLSPPVFTASLCDLLEVTALFPTHPMAKEILRQSLSALQSEGELSQTLRLFRQVVSTALSLCDLTSRTETWEKIREFLERKSQAVPDIFVFFEHLLGEFLKNFQHEWLSPLMETLEGMFWKVYQRADPDLLYEPSCNICLGHLARYHLFTGHFSRSEELLKRLLLYLPQSLSYNFQLLTRYPEFIELLLGLPFPAKYDYLYQMMRHFYPHLHRPSPVSEQMIQFMEQAILGMGKLPNLSIYREMFFQDWAFQFRKGVVEDLLLLPQ